VLLNAKLANAIAGMNNGMAVCTGGEIPLIVVATVSLVDYANTVGLTNAEILIG
jgi:hypothetical protein